MTTCRFKLLLLAAAVFPLTAPPTHAGHAGEMDGPGLMPHELLIGLIGLAGVVLLALFVLAWVLWRVRGIERRVRNLEGERKP